MSRKVSKKKVDKQEISLLNFWFDLSTALLNELPEQCDDHQKLLFLAVALGTKMNHLLINLVDFGVAVSKVQLFLAPFVHCRTVAVEKTLKTQLPEMDDTTMDGFFCAFSSSTVSFFFEACCLFFFCRRPMRALDFCPADLLTPAV
ncbi:hypothetical protein TYRP_015920 [Tyrophagus putrescentiae]|nr:hypothetical protein TYRP_015920 [Tyrophagus putrescentiae]